MKTINVDQLPEPVVRAMKAVVETLREQFRANEKDSVDPARVKAAILARRKESRAQSRLGDRGTPRPVWWWVWKADLGNEG